MKFRGSKTVRIVCGECEEESPRFSVYLYEDDGFYWDGNILNGWSVYDEAELFEDNTAIGGCPKHPVD